MPSSTIAYKWQCQQCKGWKMLRCPKCFLSTETPCNCDYDRWEKEGDLNRVVQERSFRSSSYCYSCAHQEIYNAK